MLLQLSRMATKHQRLWAITNFIRRTLGSPVHLSLPGTTGALSVSMDITQQFGEGWALEGASSAAVAMEEAGEMMTFST